MKHLNTCSRARLRLQEQVTKADCESGGMCSLYQASTIKKASCRKHSVSTEGHQDDCRVGMTMNMAMSSKTSETHYKCEVRP